MADELVNPIKSESLTEVKTEDVSSESLECTVVDKEINTADSQLSQGSTIEAEVKPELIEDAQDTRMTAITGSQHDAPSTLQNIKTETLNAENSSKKKAREGRSVEKRAAELGITLPQTPAICWEPGETVDVQDKDGKWYLAKIVSVDLRRFRVRVHFVNWSNRFDQQLSLDSDRLRPASRHSARRDSLSKRSTLGNFKIGDHVIAKWTDCKKYPATIASIASNDTCEIIFYDGFRRSGVTEANMELMSEDLKAQYQSKALIKGIASSPHPTKQESVPRGRMITSRRPSAMRAREISSKLAPKSKNESKVSPIPADVSSPLSSGDSVDPNEPYWKDGKWHAPKEFIITDDHNLFKCNMADCSKSFRKESLLESHIKYYHPASSRRSIERLTVPRSTPAPPRSSLSVSRNRKSSGTEPTSPNPSVHAAKRRRFASTGAEAVLVDTQVKSPATSFDSVEGESHSPGNLSDKRRAIEKKSRRSREKSGCSEASDDEDDDYLDKDGRLVNCVCGKRTEHLVIVQCDVCRSWQHAKCVQVSESRAPKTYTCPFCLDPKDCRRSALYTHDQNWWLTGQLPKFSFTSPSTAHRATERVRLTHLLKARALHVQRALHSHRSLLYAVRRNKEQELRLWNNTQATSVSDSTPCAPFHSAETGMTNSPSADDPATVCGDVSQPSTSANCDQRLEPSHEADSETDRGCQADLPDLTFDRKLNLLSHVTREQDEADKQLDSLEDQIAWLEAVVDGRKLDANINPLADFSIVKQTTHKILSDLGKVDQMAEYSISS